MAGTCPFQRTYDSIVAVCEDTFQRPGQDGRRPRAFHRKTHACLRATLRITPPEDAALRHGLFAAAGSYPAIVRLSSSNFDDDRLADARGMAIKISGVHGEVCEGAPRGQQDFVLLNLPAFTWSDADEVNELFGLLRGVRRLTPLSMVPRRFVVPRPSLSAVRWRYLASLMDVARRHLSCRDLSRFTYNSTTPYRLGDTAVKYVLWPEPATLARKGRGRTFATRLQSCLDGGDLRFSFHLQPTTGEPRMIADATSVWTGPTAAVGTLEIPSQDVAELAALGERLAFSPWNCLEVHRPLGSVNEARRAAYAASAYNRGGDARFPEGAGAGVTP